MVRLRARKDAKWACTRRESSGLAGSSGAKVGELGRQSRGKQQGCQRSYLNFRWMYRPQNSSATRDIKCLDSRRMSTQQSVCGDLDGAKSSGLTPTTGGSLLSPRRRRVCATLATLATKCLFLQFLLCRRAGALWSRWPRQWLYHIICFHPVSESFWVSG